MRVVTYETLIKRNRQTAQYSFLISIAVLVGTLFFGGQIAGNDPNLVFFLNCGLPPLLFMLILYAVRMSNQWIREPVAWKALQEALRGHSSNAVLYHFIFPARHVLIGPSGVYVLVPYFHERPILVKDDKWQMPGGLLAELFTFMRQERIGNPTVEAKAEAATLQKFLDKHLEGHSVEVKPVIVFTSPRAVVRLTGEQSVPVTGAFARGKSKDRDADAEETPEETADTPEEEKTETSSAGVQYRLPASLKEYMRTQRDAANNTTLSEEQIRQIEDRFIYENAG